MTTRADEEAAIEEMRRVLTVTRFATVHDVARSIGLRELAEGSQIVGPAEHSGEVAEELPRLPTRR